VIDVCMYVYGPDQLLTSLGHNTHVCARMCVYVYLCVYMYVYTYTYTSVYIYIYIYIQIHIHVCMHMYLMIVLLPSIISRVSVHVNDSRLPV
jgi:hypothetical protein